MVKLLIVSNNMAGGGAEKVLIMLLNELRPPEYSVDLLLIKNKGVYLDSIPPYINVRAMIDVSGGNSPFPTDIACLEAYCGKFISNEYDVEIAFLEGPPTKLIACHTNSSAMKIAWIHIDLQHVHWTYPYYASDEEELAIYNKFDKIVFVSEGAKEAFSQRFTSLQISYTVITNPTDCDSIRGQASEYSTPSYPFCFCTIGSLVVRKGHSRLLYAVGRLIAEGFRFHLNLLGEGTDYESLNSLAHILDIDTYVHWIGFQKNPYPYIANCDVVVSSSIAEGFPLVLSEALCLHRPIIATRCHGNRDVLQDGRFGLLVDNTEEGLYYGMKLVLTDRSFLSKLIGRSISGADSLKYDATMSQVHTLLHHNKTA
jgi:glycosyltransferase involved in cell wall biosynthesis